MGLYAIRHLGIPTFSSRTAVNLFARHQGQWEQVALIQANDLEHAFELSNHIRDDWTQGPAVKWVAPGGQRSTSVGDVIVDPNGLAYAVAPIGYTLVAHLEPPALPLMLPAPEQA